MQSGATVDTGKKKAITITQPNGLGISIQEGASVTSKDDPIHGEATTAPSGSITITNSGSLESTDGGQGIDLDDVSASSKSTIINTATGKIVADDADGVRPGSNATVINAGSIFSYGDPGNSHDGIDFQSYAGTVDNQSGGIISGARHGITSSVDVNVVNEAGGTITGRNGSGVGSDGTGTVLNYGTITGAYDGSGTGDGDGVDIDDKATVTNYGTIQATGAAGQKSDGRWNVSEGLALSGGGMVYNGVGAVITSASAGITACCTATASYVITNYGLIHGDDHGLGLFSVSDVVNYGTVTGNNAVVVGTSTDTRTVVNLDNYGTLNGDYNAVYVDSQSLLNLTIHSGSTVTGKLITDGTLNLATGDDITVGSDIENSGKLEISGTGSITLTGTNTYAGGTQVDAGATVVGKADSFSNGAIADDGTLIIKQDQDNTLSNALSGSGDVIKEGAGNLTLADSNDLSGRFLVNEGALTGSASSFGTAKIEDDAKITLNQTVDGKLGGVVSGTGLLVKEGAGNLTLGDDNTLSGTIQVNTGTLTGSAGSFGTAQVIDDAKVVVTQNTDGTLAGALSGTGDFVKEGAGNLTLSVSYDLTGRMRLLTDDNGNGLSGRFLVNEGALTGSAGAFGTAQIIDNAKVVVTQNTDATFNNALSGAGDFIKQGTGNLTLAGDNDLTGQVLVSSGTLTGSAGAFGTGQIVDNATVVADQAVDGTLGNVLAGSGDFVKEGAGNLTLGDDSTLSGKIMVNAGTLTGSAGSFGTAQIIDNAKVVVDQNVDATLGGPVSGGGDFVKEGTGNLTLNGASGMTGRMIIDSGVLTGTTLNLASGAIQNNGTVVIDQNVDGSLAGDLSGSGTFIKRGTGDVTLTGDTLANSTIRIADGTLTGAAKNFSGLTIVNDASLRIAQNDDANFSNAVAGTGRFIKDGSGALTMSGDNTYTGPTLVESGSLDVTGSIAQSAVTVSAGAALAGNGEVGSAYVASGGELDTASHGLGNGLTVKGDLTLASGADYKVAIGANSATSGVMVQGAAHIDGSSVSLSVNGAPPLSVNTHYQLLEASGGVYGRFSTVSMPLSNPYYFLSPEVQYAENAAYLEMTRNGNTFASVAGTRNQRSVASALDRMSGGGVVAAVQEMGKTQAAHAYNALSGEIHASARTAMIENAFYVRNAALDRLDTADCIGGVSHSSVSVAPGSGHCSQTGMTLWGQAYGAWGNNHSDGNAAGMSREVTGFVIGADRKIFRDWRAGGLVSYGHSSLKAGAVGSSANTNDVTVGAYAGRTSTSRRVPSMVGTCCLPSAMFPDRASIVIIWGAPRRPSATSPIAFASESLPASSHLPMLPTSTLTPTGIMSMGLA
ncbi:hypothetical protein AA14337_2934 [Acetobacter malorum DSM 14337]|uniref:Autotransporter domain-containing protein n=1 Tax=Acetobacter malorum DSM 14337 TaxID=1307910 RepID=A0ABQ0PYP0_9PROT|nr:hypothetical protein AA14337_2934 [Acetobacter malorum DSM 14337]